MSSLYELSQDEKAVYYITTLGELLVLGASVIESENDTALDINTVTKALDFMQRRHPLMRAHLEFDSNKIFYKINETLEIDINRDVEFEILKSKDQLQSKLEEFNTRLFDYKSKCKLWRVCVYSFVEHENGSKQYAIGILMPLFITDGINITTISMELINIINSILTNTECIEMRNHLEMIDNLDQLVEKHSLIQEKQLQRIKTIQNEPRLDFKLSPKFRCDNEAGFKLNLFNIEPELTSRIIKANKQNKSKLSAYLTTVAIYALKDLYDENNIYFPKDLCFGMATNIRFRLKPSIDFSHIRSLTTYLEPRIFYPKFGLFENVWSDTVYLDTLISEASNMEDGSIFAHSHNYEHAEEINHLFQNNPNTNDVISSLNCDNSCDLGISNIGTYVFNSHKPNPSTPFKIVESYFTDSLCSSRSCLCCCTFYHVSFWDGKLMFALSSNKAQISSQFTDRLAQLYKDNLLKSVEKFYS